MLARDLRRFDSGATTTGVNNGHLFRRTAPPVVAGAHSISFAAHAFPSCYEIMCLLSVATQDRPLAMINTQFEGK